MEYTCELVPSKKAIKNIKEDIVFLSYVVKFFRPISWLSVEIKPALANNFIFPPSSNFF